MGQVLVTGGAGYIGSHTLVDLIEAGHEVVCVDNFANSDISALEGVEEIVGKKVSWVEADLCDLPALQALFRKHSIDAIIHFAALKAVGESVERPLAYYHNNITGMINLLQCQQKYGVRHFIFSSSCSVYGNADRLPVTEDTPLQTPESPYARTKKMCEEMIMDVAVAFPQSNYIILRYFNPAGAHESTIIGESPRNVASNLVPVITEVAIGKRKELAVFGDDYPTRDGTCVRDFIHIMDLAHAHTLALEYLLDGKNNEPVEIFNLGSGTGSTVLEVINAFEKTSGQALNYRMAPRRPGDVVAVYADYSKAKQYLGWEPQRDIEDIMQTAWAWEKKRQAL